MTLKTFAEKMRVRVQEKAGDHYEVNLEHSLGNNGTENIRLTVKTDSDSNTAPAALLNGYYDQMTDKESEDLLEKIADKIVRLCCFSDYVENDGEMLARQVMDYDFCKEKLLFKLVNTGLNQELLLNTPHIPFLDLSIIFYVRLEEKDGVEMGVTVNEYLREAWKVTAQELYQQALRNAPEKMPARFVEMDETAVSLLVMDGEITPELLNILPPVENMKDNTLYCLTNRLIRNGASVLLYPGVLKECAATCGKNLVILPSSVDEVLIMSLSDENRLGDLTEMVRGINQSVLELAKVLSDHIYRYDCQNDQIVMA